MSKLTELTCYHLDFGGTLHLGRRGIGQEETAFHLPADSLFAALVATWVEVYREEPPRLVDTFPRQVDGEVIAGLSPPFLLTSAFPFVGKVRFYPPPPLAYLKLAPETRERRLKQLKRIGFISEKLFEMVVQGEELDPWLPAEDDVQDSDRGIYLQSKPLLQDKSVLPGKPLWLTVEEVELLPESMRYDDKGRKRPLQAMPYLRVWAEEKVPRVTVDRLRNSSNIFHTGRMTFNKGCGLWFGVEWQDENWKDEFTLLLDLLADSGLGGERAVGYGHFTWEEIETRRWNRPTDGELFITLSRYHPGKGEVTGALNNESVAYELVSVGGWLGSPEASAQRRCRLWMVAEGSVVQAVGDGPWGDVTDVRPIYEKPHFPPPTEKKKFPHPVWRYGLAYPIAMEVSP